MAMEITKILLDLLKLFHYLMNKTEYINSGIAMSSNLTGRFGAHE
jgi:hypothetical protein